MPVITLPDGSQKSFDRPVSVIEIAGAIGPGLAKAALAGEVDGVLRDASFRIADDAKVRIITGEGDVGLEQQEGS